MEQKQKSVPVGPKALRMDDCLYFVQSGKRGPIKIGRTANFKSRLVRLQTGNPVELIVLHVAEKQGWQEAFWHHAFQYDRERGEWFDPQYGLGKAIKAFAGGTDWMGYARQCPLDNHAPDEWAEHLRDAFCAYEESVCTGQENPKIAAYWAIEDPDFDGISLTTTILDQLQNRHPIMGTTP